jgi:hypothetical protein
MPSAEYASPKFKEEKAPFINPIALDKKGLSISLLTCYLETKQLSENNRLGATPKTLVSLPFESFLFFKRITVLRRQSDLIWKLTAKRIRLTGSSFPRQDVSIERPKATVAGTDT